MNGVRGIEVQLGNGKKLFAGYVPYVGKKELPAVGIWSGETNTLNVLGWFIGEAEYQAFREEMQSAFGDGRWVLSIPTEEKS